VLLAFAAFFLGRNFATVVTVFSLSFLGAKYLAIASEDIAMAANPAASRGHVLYLVLDSQIGIAGFPSGNPACLRARTAVQATLDGYAFTTYPYAASNYGVTLLSIPSILNQQMLTTPDQFTRSLTPGGATIVSPNRLFSNFAARDYQVRVYQHRSIDFAAGSPDVYSSKEYSSEIAGLENVPGWGRRVLWLIGDYQGSSPLLSKVRAFLPFRAGFHRTGPLAIRSLWPSELVSDIDETDRRSLFFVHLLAPHEPYVYRADGSVRNPPEWTSDTPVPPLDFAAYQARYAAYCEQVEALSRQLKEFLGQLKAMGQLDTMTVVIHGDHGSRIYLQGGDPRQNLANQFSTLLAIRHPGARASSMDSSRFSVMTLLARDFYHGNPGSIPRAESLYWLDSNGMPRQTPVQQLWRE
jgi:hypothetical protein